MTVKLPADAQLTGKFDGFGRPFVTIEAGPTAKLIAEKEFMVDSGFNGQCAITELTRRDYKLQIFGTHRIGTPAGDVDLIYGYIYVKWGPMTRPEPKKAIFWKADVNAIETQFLAGFVMVMELKPGGLVEIG